MKSLRPVYSLTILCTLVGVSLVVLSGILAYSPLVTAAGTVCGTILLAEPDLQQSAQCPYAALAASRRPIAAVTATGALVLCLGGVVSASVLLRRGTSPAEKSTS
jgi:hypothetical protein